MVLLYAIKHSPLTINYITPLNIIQVFMKNAAKLISFGRDRNFVGLFYVILSFLIASISVGINIVIFPALLIENDISAFFIGLAATVETVFGFIGAIFISRIVRKFGAIKSVTFITICYSLIIYFLFYYQNYLLL